MGDGNGFVPTHARVLLDEQGYLYVEASVTTASPEQIREGIVRFLDAVDPARLEDIAINWYPTTNPAGAILAVLKEMVADAD